MSKPGKGMVVTGFLLLGAVFVGRLIWLSAGNCDYGGLEFDRATWKNVVLYQADNTRQRMLASLLRKHKLVGMNTGDLTQLLGEPSDAQYRGESDLCYWLGPEKGFLSIDSAWLRVWVDNSVVIRFAVEED